MHLGSSLSFQEGIIHPAGCGLWLSSRSSPSFYEGRKLETKALIPEFPGMQRLWNLSMFLVVTGCGNGCGKPPAPVVPVAPGAPGLPTAAQAKLPTTKLWLGSEELVTELARTAKEQEIGMMFRTNMAENEGMLFLFPM